uniref:Allograft inflammatory factor 1 like n=1 Tax=Monodon monoceros TaxID=40151 RepID=A0A8C6AK39_MONMO
IPGLTTSVALSNRFQGGKALCLLKARQERRPAEINRELLCDQKYSDEENLPEKLAGEIDLMSLKRVMEKRGVPKTHPEMKMISEVADFVNMALGKRSAVLKLVMMFEGKPNESSPKPAGPLQRGVASLISTCLEPDSAFPFAFTPSSHHSFIHSFTHSVIQQVFIYNLL